MFETGFVVDYIDTDAMGIVHHGSYFRWFERARVDWLAHLGSSYKEMERAGLYLPLRHAELQYLKPLFFDDRPCLKLFLEDLGPCSIDLRYEITCNDEMMTTGRTSHIVCRRLVDIESGTVRWKPARVPQEWRVRWEPLKEKKSSKSL